MTWVTTRNWIYLKSEATKYSVGFFDPEGQWHADSDYPSKEEAAARVRWLNGFKEEN